MGSVVQLHPSDPQGKRRRPSLRLLFDESLRPKWTERVETIMPPVEPLLFSELAPVKERPQRDWLVLEYTATLLTRPSRRAQDVVYFIDCGPYTKIGTTCEIRGRIKGIETHNPFPLSLWGLIPGDTKLESQLHRDLADCRRHKEWFALDPATKQDIRGWLLENGGEFYGEDKWMRPTLPTSVPVTHEASA